MGQNNCMHIKSFQRTNDGSALHMTLGRAIVQWKFSARSSQFPESLDPGSQEVGLPSPWNTWPCYNLYCAYPLLKFSDYFEKFHLEPKSQIHLMKELNHLLIHNKSTAWKSTKNLNTHVFYTGIFRSQVKRNSLHVKIMIYSPPWVLGPKNKDVLSIPIIFNQVQACQGVYQLFQDLEPFEDSFIAWRI